MRKVVLYSALLIVGLIGSQTLPSLIGDGYASISTAVRVMSMACLSFIMIHVGLEFEIDRNNLRQYGWDYVVAATAAAFPWVFCQLYFIFVMLPPSAWGAFDTWTETALAARFAAPTSAGVLFSMLAAAGLGATWLFRKARILAIFDDLDTVLLMIPLKMLLVGVKWQLGVIIAIMLLQVWIAWKFLGKLRIPAGWPWVIGYSILIVAASEGIHALSLGIDRDVPVHLEVLLPAFVLGCLIARPESGHHDDNEPGERTARASVSGVFMLLVGLSLPSLALAGASGEKPPATGLASAGSMGWGEIALHVLAITVISNLGKMFPALCYRREAHWRTRLALAVGLWPRGEVGAGVLAVSLAYGIKGPVVTVATLSLALNLVLTGVFITMIRAIIKGVPDLPGAAPDDRSHHPAVPKV